MVTHGSVVAHRRATRLPSCTPPVHRPSDPHDAPRPHRPIMVTHGSAAAHRRALHARARNYTVPRPHTALALLALVVAHSLVGCASAIQGAGVHGHQHMQVRQNQGTCPGHCRSMPHGRTCARVPKVLELGTRRPIAHSRLVHPLTAHVSCTACATWWACLPNRCISSVICAHCATERERGV